MKHTLRIGPSEKLEQLAANHVTFRHFQLDIQEMIDDRHGDAPGGCGESDCSYSREAHDLHHQVLLATRRSNKANSPRAIRAREERRTRTVTPYDRVAAVMGADAADALVRWARETA